MKSGLILPAVLFVFLSSCTKTFTCECVAETGLQHGTTTIQSKKKADAEKACLEFCADGRDPGLYEGQAIVK